MNTLEDLVNACTRCDGVTSVDKDSLTQNAANMLQHCIMAHEHVRVTVHSGGDADAVLEACAVACPSTAQTLMPTLAILGLKRLNESLLEEVVRLKAEYEPFDLQKEVAKPCEGL